MSKPPPPFEASIRPLSTTAATAVRAGQVIGSFSRAVEELVRNAASASAGRIVVTVGSRNATSSSSYLQVSDDGIGIDPESLRQYVGTEHCTSRRAVDGKITGGQSTAPLAERGESLRSIAALAVEMRVASSTLITVGPSQHQSGHNGDKKRRPLEQIVRCEKVLREAQVVSFRSSIDQAQLDSSILPPTVGASTSTSTSLFHDRKRVRPSLGQIGSTSTDEKTGTTITILGLFHRYAVRRRHREMEGMKSDAVASAKTSGLSNGTQPLVSSSSSSDRADLAQARSCLRNAALAHPLITFRLVNGRTGAVDSSWEALPSSISKSFATPRFDPSLPLSASFSSRRGTQGLPSDSSNITLSLSRRLHQLCGDALADHTTIALVYEEENSSSRGKNSWSVIGALSFNAISAFDIKDDEGKKRTTSRTRQHELIFINKRPARHGSPIADIVQNEVAAFIPHQDTCASFVLHVTCSARDVDLIIDETKSTLSVPQRERMERLMRKAVSLALGSRGYYRKKTSLRSDDMALYQARNGGSSYNFAIQEGALLHGGSVASSKFISGQVVGSGSIDDSSLPSPPNPYFATNDDKWGMTSKEVRSEASPFSEAFFSTLAAAAPAVAAPDTNASDNELDERPTSDTYGHPSEVNWTRTRVRALESQISSLAVNLGAPTVAGGGTTSSSSRHRPAPISLSKEMLANAQVIAQVDEKFIVINAGGGLLCCVDQHAADERIGLERLERRLLAEMSHTCTPTQQQQQDDAASGISGEQLLRLVPLLPAQSIPLSSAQLSVVIQRKDLLENWRFAFKLPSADNATLLLNGVPGVCDKVATRQDFCQFIQALESRTSDAHLIKPAFVKKRLASQACSKLLRSF